MASASVLKGLGRRLVRYWTWWRSVLLATGAILAALAVATDSRGLAAVLMVAAVAPLALLWTTTGSRVDEHHRRLGEHHRGLGEHDRRLDEVRRRAVGTAEDVSRAEERLSGIDRRVLDVEYAAAVPATPADLTIVVPRPVLDDRTASLLDALETRLPGPGILIVDRSREGSVSTGLVDRLPVEGWQVLRAPGTAPEAVDAGLGAAAGRYLLVLPESVGPRTVAAVIELARRVPPAGEPWIGWRRHGERDDLILLRTQALRELGGHPPGGVDAVTFDLLEGLGYVGDELGWTAAGPPRTSTASSGRRRTVRIDRARHEASGAVVLLPQAGYHVHELAPLADALAARGADPIVMVHDRWWNGCRAALTGVPVPVFAQPPPGAWQASVAAFVTLNDWAKHEKPLIETANSYDVPTFGKVEGVQDFGDVDTGRSRLAYQRVRTVLCQGPNDLTAVSAHGGAGAVVGSSRLEAIWSEPPRAAGDPLVVVNLNFTWGVLEAEAEAWLASVVEGCARAGLPFVVSLHPAQDPPAADVPIASDPIDVLLCRSSVLVSRFSTVPFEAMAQGVPFVYHNPHGEQVAAFAEPDGAFEVSTDAASLAAALEQSMTWVHDYRARCERFFLSQVDIDPKRSSAERAAAVILDQLGP